MKKNTIKYLEVADQIRGVISEGGLLSGDLLPTVRDIASSNNCSIHTVQRALAILNEEGLIEGKQGAGLRVCESAISSSKSKTILVIFPAWNQLKEESFAANIVLGASMRASDLGYTIETADYRDRSYDDLKKIRAKVESNTYAGIIWANPTPTDVPLASRFEAIGNRIVYTHRHFNLLDSPSTLENFDTTFTVFVEELLKRKLKSIAIFGHPLTDETYQPVLVSLMRKLTDSGIDISKAGRFHIPDLNYSLEARGSLLNFIQSTDHVDAFWFFTPNIMQHLQENVPESLVEKFIGLYSIGTLPGAGADFVVSSNVRLHAETAVTMLDEWISSGKSPSSRYISL